MRVCAGSQQKTQTLNIVMACQQAHSSTPAPVLGAGIGTGLKKNSGTLSVRIIETMLQQGSISAFITGIHLSPRSKGAFPHLGLMASKQKPGGGLHSLCLRYALLHQAGNRSVVHPIQHRAPAIVARSGISSGGQQQGYRINAIIPNGEHQRGAATAIARIHGHPLLQQLTHSLSITATGSI